MEARVVVTSSQKWYPITFRHILWQIIRPSTQSKPRSLHKGVNTRKGVTGRRSWLPTQLK